MPEKRIKDLMLGLGSFDRVQPKTRVADAVKLLDEKWQDYHPAILLVVDEVENKEEILGMLSMDDIVGHMEPTTDSMDELPIFWQGQFREECEAILEKQASEIMSPVTHVIHQGGTLMEAVHLMNSRGIDWVPVVEEEDVVGILLKEALFKDVFAAIKPETD